ncbi:unnamed protein product [Rotaria sordida]|uniref:C-type lectin domain-containing protein n=1 Tax=Rotaria sordida TaxID=392033 RepID=A0A819LY36_9BILA|nr:unnamed protein product [Rotaria sordida]
MKFLGRDIVSITIEKKCSTDDDCDLELMCNIESHICTCPEPYFWRQDIRACYGCAPGWLKLQTNKCLLYAISHSSGVTWYEAKKTCKSLIAQPLIINNVNEFIALQDQIEYLLNGNDELAASLYFYQGAWVQINNEWSELYTWCNNDDKEDFYDCVQIRQNSITNTICLQYVSCIQQSQYICEASPLAQAELETNIADAERSDIKNRNEEIMIRASTKKPALTTKRTTLRTTTKTTSRTTQKKPGFSINNAADALTNGINAVGQISNALGNVLGGNTNQNSQQPNAIEIHSNVIPNNVNDEQTALALSSSDDDSSNKALNNILFYGGIAVGVIILIIIIIIVVYCIKKNTNSSNSRPSFTSVVSEE